MLTDDEARRLLNRAGETVTVDPSAPIDEPGRRRIWPVLAAVAAVVAVAATTAVLTGRGATDDPEPTPPAVEEVQVPSTLGTDLEAAEAALRGAGLSPRIEAVPTCSTTYVLGTLPPAGTPVAPGTDVVVRNGVPADNNCWSEVSLAGDLLALAEGRHSRFKLDNDMQAWDGDDPTDVGAVLDRFVEAVRTFYPATDPGRYTSPSFVVTSWREYDQSIAVSDCDYFGGPASTNRDHVSIGVVASDDVGCPDFVIDAFYTDHVIDTLVLRTLGDEPPPDPDPEPAIGAAFRDFARGGELPPMADQVDLYLGNAFTGFVTRQSAQDRPAWATCTELGHYAGISCPLSPLDVVKQHPPVEYLDAAKDRCLKTYGPIPPELRTLGRVVIVPAEGSVDSCIDDFAVQLFANDDGELVAVSLLLGEP